MQAIFTSGTSTSLGDVYKGLACGKLQSEVEEWLADQTSEPAHWAFPGITHADGFEAYQVMTPHSTRLLDPLWGWSLGSSSGFLEYQN